MIIVWFFDLSPIILGALILIMALAGKLVEVMPIIQVIFWILFALLCLGALYILIADSYDHWMQRVLHGVTFGGSLLFLGTVSHQFFVSVIDAYGDGGFGGFFELLITLVFGIFVWLFEFMAATYVAIMLPSTKDGEVTTVRLVFAAICAIGLVIFALV